MTKHLMPCDAAEAMDVVIFDRNDDGYFEALTQTDLVFVYNGRSRIKSMYPGARPRGPGISGSGRNEAWSRLVLWVSQGVKPSPYTFLPVDPEADAPDVGP